MPTEKQLKIMQTVSPFDDSSLYLDSDGILYTSWINYIYYPKEGDQLHTVLSGETLQHIAYKYYGDSGYWYKIGIANRILNPFKEVQDGMILIIPDNS